MTPSAISKRQERLTVNIQRVIDAGGISNASSFTRQTDIARQWTSRRPWKKHYEQTTGSIT